METGRYAYHYVNTPIIRGIRHDEDTCGKKHIGDMQPVHVRCPCGHLAHYYTGVKSRGVHSRYWHCHFCQRRLKTITEVTDVRRENSYSRDGH